MRGTRIVCFLLTGFLFCVAALQGQSTGGTISGAVKDETQAVLPGATVTITNLETGMKRTVVTDDGGRYHALNLSLGKYEVRAELPGFQTTIWTGIELTIGRDAIADLVLKVGEVSETVTVTGEAPLVETRKAELGELVSREKIETLPLNGRSFQQLAILQPGTSISTKARSDASRGRGIKVNAAGTRHQFNQFLLDGMETMDARNTTPASIGGTLLGVEAVREFKVLTNNYSAEYGRNAGAVISISTRSGTNEFHGSVYEFHRNDNLDARNFFDAEDAPEFKRNQFGFSVEGPVRQNQTFFLFNYEALREGLGVTKVGLVPDAGARRGILPGRAPFTVDPKVKPYLDLLPLPNGQNFGNGVGEFVWSRARPTVDDYFTARFDHSFSDADSLFVRYTFDQGDIQDPMDLPVVVALENNRAQNAVIEENRIFGPRLLNQFRLGYNRFFRFENVDFLVSVTPEMSFISGRRMGTIAVSGITGLDGVTNDPKLDLGNTFELADNVTFTKGSHDLKFGFSGKRFQYRRGAFIQMGAGYQFASLFEFLTLGNIDRIRASGLDLVELRDMRQKLFGFYLQDQWTLRPNLTLSQGLRYEFITIPEEIHGAQGHLRDPLTDTKFNIGKDARIFSRNPSLRNFAPRIGIAWDPFGRGTTSVRTGFGFFFDQVLMAGYSDNIDDVPPFRTEVDLRNVPGQLFFPRIPPSELRPLIGTVGFSDPNLSTPYMMHYNLSLQHEFPGSTVVTAAYAGSRGTHIYRKRSINMRRFEIREGGAKFFPVGAPRLNPNFATMEMNSTDGNSFFNSLQLGMNRRFTAGFAVQFSYTFSKSVDDMSQVTERTYVANLTRPADGFDRTDNRALSDFNTRQSFVVNSIYDLPLGKGKRLLSESEGFWGKLIQGWQVAGILAVASGAPFSVELGFDRARSLTSDGQRPLLLGGNNNPTQPGNPDSYFDVSAFGLPPAGFLGGPGRVGRNTLIGPGLANLDLSLLKNTALTQTVRLQFRAEVFNVLNRANFQTPGATLTGGARPLDSQGTPLPQAGRVTETASTSRQIQFGLRLVF
ncbi:MAG: TonB-dependent receptor [Acidobacteria bacterium]|nr:TonB-dependent receptor [Acidobacteriota bacterium]